MAQVRENAKLPQEAQTEAVKGKEIPKIPREVTIDVRRAREAARTRQGLAGNENRAVTQALQGKEARSKNILERGKAFALAGIVALTTGVTLKIARELGPTFLGELQRSVQTQLASKEKKSAPAEVRQNALDRYNKNIQVADAILKWKTQNPELADKIQDIKILDVKQTRSLAKLERITDTEVMLSIQYKDGRTEQLPAKVSISENPNSMRELLERAVPSTIPASDIVLRRAVEQGLASLEKNKG